MSFFVSFLNSLPAALAQGLAWGIRRLKTTPIPAYSYTLTAGQTVVPAARRGAP